MPDPRAMQGVNVFCERCGTLQPKPEEAPRSAGVLARRVLDAVGLTETRHTPADDWLRLCLNCRGYSCPACWNETAGVCQTCEPLPEPVVEHIFEPVVQPITYPPAPEPIHLATVDPVQIAEPEPVAVAEQAPEPVVGVEPEPEPVVVAEPEPEPEPEPFFEPVPAERPAVPRMPVLPMPPPRPADAPAIPFPPLTPLPAYPVAPHISFGAQVSAAASAATAAPAFEAHMLLAPPPELPAASIAAGLRPCGNCHLTLSARAHFCRRCGTQQPH